MGWSPDLIKIQIEAIFEQHEVKMAWRLLCPDAVSPRVHLQTAGELPLEVKQEIAAALPDFVRVDFMPNVSWVGVSVDELIKSVEEKRYA